MRTTKVTVYELFSIYFLTIFVTIFMYMSSNEAKVALTDTALKPLLYPVIVGISGIPMFFYIKKYRAVGLLENMAVVSPALSKVFAFFYLIVCYIVLIRTASRFDLFASSVLFSESNMAGFLIAILIICALLSTLGFGAVGRSSAIFLILVAAGMIFILFSVTGDMHYLNLTPVFQRGFSKFMSESAKFAFFSIELGTIPLFLPEIEGDIKKGMVRFVLLMTGSSALLTFTVVSTLGAFADTQLFPAFAVSALGRYKLFERLDALETAVWMFCVITKLTFYFLCAVKCIRQIIPKINKWLALTAAVAPVVAFVIYISQNIERFSFLAASAQITVSFVAAVIALPTAALLILKKKETRDEKKPLV